MQTLRARQVPWSNPVAVGLREALLAESSRGSGESAADDGSGIAVFLIIYEVATGQPVGCGGLRVTEDGQADAVYVYVVPYARWSGVSAAVLEELTCWARVHGLSTSAPDAALDRAATLGL
jgi:GNAT superfamily N-acetyltransferase